MLILMMLFVAVYLAKPVFTGKGKLLEAENLKEGKEQDFKKYLRLLYTGVFVMSLLIGFVNIASEYGYTRANLITFTQDYVDNHGVEYKAGEVYSEEELIAKEFELVPSTQQQSASLCAPVPQQELPYSVEQQEPVLKWQWLSFLPLATMLVLNYVFMGISVLLVVGIFVVMNIYTDKEKKAKAQEAAVGRKPSMPSAAFDFDEDEPTFPVNEKDM